MARLQEAVIADPAVRAAVLQYVIWISMMNIKRTNRHIYLNNGKPALAGFFKYKALFS